MFRVAPVTTPNTVTVDDAEGNEIARAVVPTSTNTQQLLHMPRGATYGANQVGVQAAASESSALGMPIWDGFTIAQTNSGCHLETFYTIEWVSHR
jgi:hypothetical protein